MNATFTAEQSAALAKVRSLRDDIARNFQEREDEATVLAVALLAREHVLLLGLPGTGKSALTNAVSASLDSRTFDRLLTAFTMPEELFGPYSIQGLQEDRYERKVDGYLPECQVAFLDEIFKAGSPILNALLTLLNERAFDNGTTRMACPLEICIGASNELPADNSLDALYDRFMLRRWVQPIKDRDCRKALLRSKGKPVVSVRITRDELAKAREAADLVTIPETVEDALLDLHDALGTELGLYVSDRRVCKLQKLVQAHAALEGRSVATLDDLLVLTDAIWTQPNERPGVHALVCKAVAPALADALRVYDAAVELMANVPESGLAHVQKLAEANQALADMVKAIKAMADGSERVLAIAGKVEAFQNDIARKIKASMNLR